MIDAINILSGMEYNGTMSMLRTCHQLHEIKKYVPQTGKKFTEFTPADVCVYGVRELQFMITQSDILIYSLCDILCEHGHIEILKYLHDNFECIITTKSANLAAKSGHLNIVKWLNTVCPNCIKLETVQSALYSNNIELLEYLHEYVYFPNKLFENSVSVGNFGAAVWLYVMGIKPEIISPELYVKAAEHGNLEMMIWLGSKLSTIPKLGAVMMAAKHDHLHIIASLYTVEMYNYFNISDLCVKYNSINTLKQLQHYAHVSMDAFNAAASHGYMEIMVYLYECGYCEPNEETMIDAVCSGNVELVKWLSGIMDFDIGEAISEAKEYGHVDIVRYLAGAPFPHNDVIMPYVWKCDYLTGTSKIKNMVHMAVKDGVSDVPCLFMDTISEWFSDNYYYVALMNGHLEIIKLFYYATGEMPDLRTAAIMENQFEILRFLYDIGMPIEHNHIITMVEMGNIEMLNWALPKAEFIKPSILMSRCRDTNMRLWLQLCTG